MLRVITICFLLASCATQPDVHQPIEGKAVLVAMNDAWGKALVPLQSQASTGFESIDGEKASDFFSSAEYLAIEPGEHRITLQGHGVHTEQGAVLYF